MRTIYLTGSTGFVGTAFSEYFSRDRIVCHPKTSTVNIGNASIVVNLAGKAKDTGGTRNSEEYFHVNYEFAKSVFDAFLESKAEVFITMSSVKAVADSFDGLLSEDTPPRPISTYGKSKLLSEQYILSKQLPEGKRVYILRPCIIHGPGNKGNLSLLYKTVSIGIPWFLGSYNNKRSYCSIENLLFVLNELIERKVIPSGIYHVADDLPLSTNWPEEMSARQGPPRL